VYLRQAFLVLMCRHVSIRDNETSAAFQVLCSGPKVTGNHLVLAWHWVGHNSLKSK
jgi:hypothetical protein